MFYVLSEEKFQASTRFPKTAKVHSFVHLTDREKKHARAAFDRNSSFHHSLFVRDRKSRSDDPSAALTSEERVVLTSFLREHAKVREEEMQKEMGIFCARIQTFTRQALDDLPTNVSLLDLTAIVTRLYFEQYAHRFLSFYPKSDIAAFLAGIGREDLQVFFEYFAEPRLVASWDSSLLWQFHSSSSTVDWEAVAKTPKQTVHLIRAHALLSASEKGALGLHALSLSDHQAMLKEDDDYDDEDWEYALQQRNAALAFFDELLTREFQPILSLWLDAQNRSMLPIKQLIADLALSYSCQFSAAQPLITDYVSDLLFHSNTSLRLVRVPDRHDEDDYYAYLGDVPALAPADRLFEI